MKYNLSKIMKRAWKLVKKVGMSISSGLKKAWEEAKMVKEIKNVVLKEYMSYNKRRYSKPWICKMQNTTFLKKLAVFPLKMEKKEILLFLNLRLVKYTVLVKKIIEAMELKLISVNGMVPVL